MQVVEALLDAGAEHVADAKGRLSHTDSALQRAQEHQVSSAMEGLILVR